MLRKTGKYFEKKSYTPQLRGFLSNWTALDIEKVISNTAIPLRNVYQDRDEIAVVNGDHIDDTTEEDVAQMELEIDSGFVLEYTEDGSQNNDRGGDM